jgi:hypothetical protein
MNKQVRAFLVGFFCVGTLVPGFCQDIYKEAKIELNPLEISFPVYYFNQGYTTVFNAVDLLNDDTLMPLLNKYDMLQYTQDSVWINDLVNLAVYDSTYVWQGIKLRQRMNFLYTNGQVEIVKGRAEKLDRILVFREENLPIVGTNYYYAESKKSKRIFEYFSVFWGCPAF